MHSKLDVTPDLEVTIPRVVIFRDAIVDLLVVEMGARLSKKAKEGWQAMLNWVGGAYIYVRMKFTDRLKILASSWATANNKVLSAGVCGTAPMHACMHACMYVCKYVCVYVCMLCMLCMLCM